MHLLLLELHTVSQNEICEGPFVDAVRAGSETMPPPGHSMTAQHK